MKKNFIIIVLIACLCFTTYTTFSYKMKYNQISQLYLRNKMKPAVESMEKRSQQKQQNRTVRWNYLDETDINRNPVIIYNPNVKSTGPQGGVSRIMAARIAEAIWITRFGNKMILCRPYSVISFQGKWIIAANNSEDGIGDAYMEISQKDGRIVRYIMAK